MAKLTGKIIISGSIKAVTGLHIGGSKSSLDIGGVDLNVIKTRKGTPFIPGSSLKGKLRSMLAKTENSLAVSAKDIKNDDERRKLRERHGNFKTDDQIPFIIQLFGSSGDDENGVVTRVLVRDAYLDEAAFEREFGKATEYADIKWENTIDRKTGTAKHPRQLERVPAGSIFKFEIVYDLYNDADSKYESGEATKLQKHLRSLDIAMRLLEDDYIGGHGSRGYGRIAFEDVKVVQKNVGEDKYAATESLHADVADFKSKWQPVNA